MAKCKGVLQGNNSNNDRRIAEESDIEATETDYKVINKWQTTITYITETLSYLVQHIGCRKKMALLTINILK